ncbi:hypothetical protein EKE94_03150 [Mesobaculum littorinae]|uniref:Uncharacterized protein n=1 Tax=Mesobaculum littorinae TaxID=2486419 RepID=A0A438ALG4_9RHOB|nr:hypothetical protein [Mesobaculum littorinae]RVV99693.1 hypothetical protein EKE94_03150 [Mesobaculum littorinae]
MHIDLHIIAGLPGQPDDTASVAGDVLTHNGTAYDLSAVPEGGSGTLEGDHPFVGPITREGGVLRLGLRLTYDAARAEADQPADPAHWRVEVTEGPVPDRVIRKTTEEEGP